MSAQLRERGKTQAFARHDQSEIMDVSQAIMTAHASAQASERQVDVATVRAVLAEPEQVWPVRPGRVVAQRMMGEYLVRVFLDVDREPAEVVTVYRTSKIDKYRSRR